MCAVAGDCRDTICIRKVAEPNPAYSLPEQEIVNWLDREVLPQPAGFCSVYDTIGTITHSADGLALVESMMNEGNGTNIHVPFDAAMRKMMQNETLASIVIRKSKGDPKDALKTLNAKLNRIARA